MESENPKPLLDLIIRSFECRKESEFHKIMNDLKRELPFDHYGVFRIYIGTKELLNVDFLEWNCDVPDFRKLLNEDRLLRFIPDFLNQMRPDLKDEIINQLWWTQYRKCLRGMPRRTDGSELIHRYIRRFGGCFCIYQVNPILHFVFFCGGKKMRNNPRHRQIMETIVPALSVACENTRLGRTKRLTEREFEMMRVCETALRNKNLAKYFKLSISTIEKHKAMIKLKTGVKHRYQLCEKKPGDEVYPLDFDREFPLKAPTR